MKTFWVCTNDRLHGRVIEASSWYHARQIAWQLLGEHGAPVELNALGNSLQDGVNVVQHDELGGIVERQHAA